MTAQEPQLRFVYPDHQIAVSMHISATRFIWLVTG